MKHEMLTELEIICFDCKADPSACLKPGRGCQVYDMTLNERWKRFPTSFIQDTCGIPYNFWFDGSKK